MTPPRGTATSSAVRAALRGGKGMPHSAAAVRCEKKPLTGIRLAYACARVMRDLEVPDATRTPQNGRWRSGPRSRPGPTPRTSASAIAKGAVCSSRGRGMRAPIPKYWRAALLLCRSPQRQLLSTPSSGEERPRIFALRSGDLLFPTPRKSRLQDLTGGWREGREREQVRLLGRVADALKRVDDERPELRVVEVCRGMRRAVGGRRRA